MELFTNPIFVIILLYICQTNILYTLYLLPYVNFISIKLGKKTGANPTGYLHLKG